MENNSSSNSSYWKANLSLVGKLLQSGSSFHLVVAFFSRNLVSFPSSSHGVLDGPAGSIILFDSFDPLYVFDNKLDKNTGLERRINDGSSLNFILSVFPLVFI